MMNSAREKLKVVLDRLDIKKPALSFIGNVNASYETDAERIKENLLTQLTSRTYWEDSVKLLANDGVKTFLEIGPGKVLKGLLRRIGSNLVVHNIGTIEEINEYMTYRANKVSECKS